MSRWGNNNDEVTKQNKSDNSKQKEPSDFYLDPSFGISSRRKKRTLSNDTYFMRGVLSGVLLAFLLLSLLYSIFYFSKETRRNSNGGTVSLDYSEVAGKLNVLEQYINGVYLDEVEEDKLEDGIYNGFISGLGDRYSAYYNQEEYKDLMESTDGQYCGIGAYVKQDPTTKEITIVSPFEGGPADKAGVKEGDILYTVAGVEVTGKDLTQVVNSMKGSAGKKVKISVLRERG